MSVTGRSELAVEAVGCATALGTVPTQVGAALRAKLSRPAPLDDAEVLDDDTLEPMPRTGHPMPWLTAGFAPLGRRVALARAAVESLLAHAPHLADDPRWARTAVIFALTAPTEETWLESPHDVIPGLARALTRGALHCLGLAVDEARVEVVLEGHTGTAFALARAQAMVPREAERALVVAVDSLCDAQVLEALADDDRLKGPDNPVGLVPGEAAVALLLEPLARARPGAPRLASVATSRAPLAAEARQGVALGDVALAALDRAGLTSSVGALIGDHNGEERRARVWGHARVRLGTRCPPRVAFPAVSLGDTGAASGALGLLLGAHLLARGAAGGPSVLVTSVSEPSENGTAVGAVVLAGRSA